MIIEIIQIITNYSYYCYRNTICNRIKGTTEGELFPSYLDKHAVFRIFRKAFCKAIPIVFKKEVIMDNGLDGYLYSMSDDFLDTSEENPNNACYCQKKKQCLKKGLSDITPCYYSKNLLLIEKYSI